MSIVALKVSDRPSEARSTAKRANASSSVAEQTLAARSAAQPARTSSAARALGPRDAEQRADRCSSPARRRVRRSCRAGRSSRSRRARRRRSGTPGRSRRRSRASAASFAGGVAPARSADDAPTRESARRSSRGGCARARPASSVAALAVEVEQLPADHSAGTRRTHQLARRSPRGRSRAARGRRPRGTPRARRAGTIATPATVAVAHAERAVHRRTAATHVVVVHARQVVVDERVGVDDLHARRERRRVSRAAGARDTRRAAADRAAVFRRRAARSGRPRRRRGPSSLARSGRTARPARGRSPRAAAPSRPPTGGRSLTPIDDIERPIGALDEPLHASLRRWRARRSRRADARRPLRTAPAPAPDRRPRARVARRSLRAAPDRFSNVIAASRSGAPRTSAGTTPSRTTRSNGIPSVNACGRRERCAGEVARHRVAAGERRERTQRVETPGHRLNRVLVRGDDARRRRRRGRAPRAAADRAARASRARAPAVSRVPMRAQLGLELGARARRGFGGGRRRRRAKVGDQVADRDVDLVSDGGDRRHRTRAQRRARRFSSLKTREVLLRAAAAPDDHDVGAPPLATRVERGAQLGARRIALHRRRNDDEPHDRGAPAHDGDDVVQRRAVGTRDDRDRRAEIAAARRLRSGASRPSASRRWRVRSSALRRRPSPSASSATTVNCSSPRAG